MSRPPRSPLRSIMWMRLLVDQSHPRRPPRSTPPFASLDCSFLSSWLTSSLIVWMATGHAHTRRVRECPNTQRQVGGNVVGAHLRGRGQGARWEPRRWQLCYYLLFCSFRVFSSQHIHNSLLICKTAENERQDVEHDQLWRVRERDEDEFDFSLHQPNRVIIIISLSLHYLIGSVLSWRPFLSYLFESKVVLPVISLLLVSCSHSPPHLPEYIFCTACSCLITIFFHSLNINNS